MSCRNTFSRIEADTLILHKCPDKAVFEKGVVRAVCLENWLNNWSVFSKTNILLSFKFSLGLVLGQWDAHTWSYGCSLLQEIRKSDHSSHRFVQLDCCEAHSILQWDSFCFLDKASHAIGAEPHLQSWAFLNLWRASSWPSVPPAQTADGNTTSCLPLVRPWCRWLLTLGS